VAEKGNGMIRRKRGSRSYELKRDLITARVKYEKARFKAWEKYGRERR
jgi:hypothetical protein